MVLSPPAESAYKRRGGRTVCVVRSRRAVCVVHSHHAVCAVRSHRTVCVVHSRFHHRDGGKTVSLVPSPGNVRRQAPDGVRLPASVVFIFETQALESPLYALLWPIDTTTYSHRVFLIDKNNRIHSDALGRTRCHSCSHQCGAARGDKDTSKLAQQAKRRHVGRALKSVLRGPPGSPVWRNVS